MRNMRIVIVGGGKVGRYLAASLMDRKNRITIIEQDRFRCRQLAWFWATAPTPTS